ncbi:MAG: PepSY-associated TM helix domain-containing protein [Bacteroidota bacterium]
MKKYFPLVRSLHLYIGLFLSPLIIIFSISVLVLNHTEFFKQTSPVRLLPDIQTHIDRIPIDTSDLRIAKSIIVKLGIEGEIDHIQNNADQISFPVTLPGLRTVVNVNKHTNEVLITRQNEGYLRATGYLHKMPGPHNVKLRGNSGFIKSWTFLADSVVYLLLFLSVSGTFLWYFLKAERSMGWYALILGAIFFSGLLLLIFN